MKMRLALTILVLAASTGMDCQGNLTIEVQDRSAVAA